MQLILLNVSSPLEQDTQSCIPVGLIFRIIKEVSRDVLPEESHIFHDWASPSKRTIKLIGHTKRGD